jgi:hypothetical protein
MDGLKYLDDSVVDRVSIDVKAILDSEKLEAGLVDL